MILNKKQNIFILLSVIIMILIIGYIAKFIHDQNAAIEKAAEVAIETMKKEKNRFCGNRCKNSTIRTCGLY
ncbi:hypothetical protein AAHB51_23615 [Bacillus cereus]|nr:hypothetical protein [Bacillus sp. OR9]MCU0097374.1 hypothetical protein [Bacillus sp. OR9]